MAEQHNHHKESQVVINGRRYGARTGRPIDGLSHPSRQPHHAQAVHVHKAEPAKPVHHAHPAPQPAHHTAAVKAKSHAVVTNLKPATTHPVLDQTAGLSAERAKRAEAIAQSAKITKFASFEPPANHHHKAEVELPKLDAKLPHIEPTHVSPPLPIDTTEPEPTQVAETKPKRQRKSHHRIKRLVRQPKALTIATAALSGLFIIAYITYLNVPHIALRVAASRAGLDASLPDYQPSGFHFTGPIAYSPGSIVLNFRSTTSDGRNYTISEHQSDWDSASLLENYVKDKTKQPLTFQQRGLTVYVYDGSSATWVDRGVWYTIEGNSLLNSDEILKIAASL